MVNRQLAEQLRREGKTYKQISDHLKCSVQWCKINLRDVPVTKCMTNEQLYQAVKGLMSEIEERIKNG